MNAIVLLIPILLIRYGLLGLLNKEALKRAAYFPPMIGKEKMAYLFYQVTTVLLFVYPAFLKIRVDSIWFYPGLIVYGLGLLLYAVSILHYAKHQGNGMSVTGLYRISRNPMYVSYFIYLSGCVLLTSSLVLLLVVIVFQVSVHWFILSEERWCVKEYGEEYVRYMERVGRYV